MNYELGKELKDARFPQNGHNKVVFTDKLHGDIEGLYIPTLSELIEACGEKFDSLVLHEKMANDGGYWEATGDEYFNGTGSTPEEAVARLWLALNQKQL